MKKNKIEIISSFIMLGILILFMFNCLFFAIMPKILSSLNLTSASFDEKFGIIKSEPKIDYSKIYPFEENDEDQNQNINLINDLYIPIVSKIKDVLENNTSKNLYGYEKMVEKSYFYDKSILYQIVSNNDNNARIKFGDGYFSIISPKVDVNPHAQELIKFNNYLKEQNINFLYVQAPFKIPADTDLLKMYKDYTNENVDDLLEKLQGKVDYIDIRKNIQEDGLNHLNLFYKTDHHWLPETGLWATNIISNYINKNYGIDLATENISEDKFNYKIYPKIFLGSDGRYVSLANAEPEDFTLITPKYETKLNIRIAEKNINKIGTYDNTLLDKTKLTENNYSYSVYLYGERQLIEINNEYVNNSKKILLIKDSFGDTVSPFLSLENEQLSIIDLRYFNGSLKKYINEYHPDLVIVLYSGIQFCNLNINNLTQQKLWENMNK